VNSGYWYLGEGKTTHNGELLVEEERIHLKLLRGRSKYAKGIFEEGGRKLGLERSTLFTSDVEDQLSVGQR